MTISKATVSGTAFSFPAAGYGEISLALARAAYPDQEYTVEDMVVKKALFLSEEAVPTVRI